MKIEKVKKNAEGDITDLMIEGNIYSIDKAIEMAPRSHHPISKS